MHLNLVSLDNAESSGADPRSVGVGSLKQAGHEKQPILRVIREKCLDCCCEQQSEVRKCVSVSCPLWPYRMGTNPFSERKGNAANLVQPVPDKLSPAPSLPDLDSSALPDLPELPGDFDLSL